ncbi:MAG: cobalt transporter CbiM [Chloroflexi bacterium]|nr:cobalt transporter CbiM [Chloroflexota bacterium]MCL5273529.1 cobalt transporter CbiM [Chloroflexota bacterium]
MLNSPAYMHIPDGYLSPLTSLILFILVLPFWYRGVRGLRRRINARNVPLIALMAAFSFIIMMFNVPLPGGTTGHAVAGALVAIVLGPDIAVIAISIALIIQAIFFGDGGILQIGANCFNMAVVLPYISYAIYRLIAAGRPITSRRRVVGAAVGGWIGLTVAAFFAAVEFGIQPIFWHAADGAPLYAPYSLSVAIPAMVIPHMLIASVIEGLVAALVVLYLQRANTPVLEMAERPAGAVEAEASGSVSRLRWLWVGLIILVIATPLGLLAPGTAWGEWSSSQLANMGLMFIPHGMAALENLWGAPLAGYDLPALGNTSLGYVLSALVGVALVAIIAWLFTRLFASAQPHEGQKEQ